MSKTELPKDLKVHPDSLYGAYIYSRDWLNNKGYRGGYLHHDGQMYYGAMNHNNKLSKFKQGWWHSVKEAQEFLDNLNKPFESYGIKRDCYFMSGIDAKDLSDTVDKWNKAGFFPLDVKIDYTAGFPNSKVNIWFVKRD